MRQPYDTTYQMSCKRSGRHAYTFNKGCLHWILGFDLMSSILGLIFGAGNIVYGNVRSFGRELLSDESSYSPLCST